MLFYLSMVIILMAFIIFFLWRKFTFWSKQGVKDKCLLDYRGLFREQHQYCLDMSNKYGRIYGGFMLTRMFIVINDPDLIRQMFVRNFAELPDHTQFNMGNTPNIYNMIFFLPGNDKWKRIRKTMTPVFSSGKLKSMIAFISEISDKLVESLETFAETGEIFDARKYVGGFALDVICACGYSININSINNPNHPLIINVKKMLNVNASLSMAFCVLAPKLARLLKLNFFDVSAVNFMIKLILQIIKGRKENTNNNEEHEKKSDFLQLMTDSLKTEDEIGFNNLNDENMAKFQRLDKGKDQDNSMSSISVDELIAQGILFLVAGYDTTSSALTHLVYYLSENKDCQQLLYEELKDVKEFSYENLSELKYLNAVIDESLRLAPPLLRIQRQGPKDFEIAGIRIPAGTSIEILPYALHRDPEFWPDPLKFKPDRFLNPTHHPWAYIPFGGGPRICIGKRFSLNEMRMCCAKLFFKYEFSLAPDFKIEYFKPHILMAAKSLMVKIKSR